MIGWNH